MTENSKHYFFWQHCAYTGVGTSLLDSLLTPTFGSSGGNSGLIQSIEPWDRFRHSLKICLWKLCRVALNIPNISATKARYISWRAIKSLFWYSREIAFPQQLAATVGRLYLWCNKEKGQYKAAWSNSASAPAELCDRNANISILW